MRFIKILVLTFVLILALVGVSQVNVLHVPGCDWESTDLTHEIDTRVHQWIDITWDATPYHVCDKETNDVYLEDGFVLLQMSYFSNADVQVSIDFPDPYFRDEWGGVLENISIYFFVKSTDAESNEDSYIQFNYNMGDLTRMGTDTTIPVWLPEASIGDIVFTINVLTSDPGPYETPAGVYYLPVRFTFNPTVSW
ncbi:hypothetical protein [Thermosipho atlanticus]|uniref:Uncharacterized protein n=1 Tax=Thermosipho atlanticus DSM 15807 TaxID=1123380 RepID=A0A1M5U6N4_9BACT|nr:hypothetical protein [Thermosipho atlanticus]SHH58541.1 hypothetical protein SAMN02745199_1649 [Thermosipho atlanticus DSM 15807]